MAFLFYKYYGWEKNQWWGWGLDKEIPGSFSDYLSLMLGKPRIRLNNLKTSLRFPCLGLNPIIDSINPNAADHNQIGQIWVSTIS